MVKLKGSTLIEIIIALTILISVFSMAFIVFNQISKNNNNYIKTYSSVIAQNTLALIRFNGKIEQQQVQKDGYEILIDPIEQSHSDVYIVYLKIKKNNKIIYETRETISNDKN